MNAEPRPSWRKPAGIFLLLALISFWAALIASFAAEIGLLPWPVQLALYLVLGTIWIAPLKPLLRWMETGRWRK